MISTTEAGRILGLSAHRMRELCQQGKISARRIEGRWFLELDAVRAFAELDRRPYWWTRQRLDNPPSAA